VNIAIAMAQGGSRTLLVDTDLRRPRVHKCFGLENRTGMSSAVISSEPLASYITSTEVPNLDLLLSGPVPPDPTALLHTERFRQIMAELEGRYDVVILDSPPVLPVTDAMIIANHADGVVLVVKSDKTTREAMAMAWQELRQVNANILGSVLNDHDVARKGYGHYTYYRHRYYNAAENTDGTSAARSG
jgi:capsular exopolysaccharide synthesis family protein